MESAFFRKCWDLHLFILRYTLFIHKLVYVLSLILCKYLQRSLKQVYIGFRLKIFYIGRINGLSMCHGRIGDFMYNLCNAALLSATHTPSFIKIVELFPDLTDALKELHNESMSARSSDIILRVFFFVLSISEFNMKQISDTVSVGIM